MGLYLLVTVIYVLAIVLVPAAAALWFAGWLARSLELGMAATIAVKVGIVGGVVAQILGVSRERRREKL